jgi:pimeloyl-ACP methyl ester carboxylesterase
VVVAGCSPARLAESVALLRDLSADAASGADAAGEVIAATPLGVTVDGRRHPADLYATPAARADLVLVPGAVPAGRAHPRVVALARALARAEFRVVVPELAGMRALQVTSDDARILAAVARRLRAEAPERPLGMAAVSFAVGPVVLAVDDGAPVDFVVAIGGYYDLVETIAYFTTGCFRRDDAASWRCRQPNAYGKWVFVLSNVPRIEDARDRRALSTIARRKLADPDADVAGLVDALGPEGRAVHALLVNDDPDRVPRLVERLPPGIRDEIAALNLAEVDVEAWPRRGIAPDFVLIHGRGDPVIPPTQSRALARALGAERARLHVVAGLGHVEAGEVGPRGSLALVQAVYRVLTLRDGGAAAGTPAP